MEKVILVGVEKKNNPDSSQKSIRELKRLTETAGGTVVRSIIQKRDKLEPATLIGKGKAQELAELSKQIKTKTIIFDDELTPAQQRNLEDITKTKVLDRSRLILDIFAKRAHTREGSLQVELAQLEYLITRLTGWGWGFSQQAGGIGTRGPGERKLEVESRHMRNRITKLKRELKSLKKHRDLQRKKRQVVPLPTITLVGYTNAGKSTLLNRLSGTESKNPVYVDDKLFATLDPTTRRVVLPDGQIVLFTDTVGFIRKLPHSLIAAFHATLEESFHADIIVHVIDASSNELDRQADTVNAVLNELGSTINQESEDTYITVYNKIDCLSDNEKKNLLHNGICPVSAQTGEGIHAFLKEIQKKLYKTKKYSDIIIPFNKMHILQKIYKIATIMQEKHEYDGIHLKIMIDPQNYGWIHKQLET